MKRAYRILKRIAAPFDGFIPVLIGIGSLHLIIFITHKYNFSIENSVLIGALWAVGYGALKEYIGNLENENTINTDSI